nr:class I SAM-dependent methyltransferase [uncultured Massilia sp.]
MNLDQPSRQRHFEALYAADDDPWHVRDAWYERRKRAILLAALGKPRYRSAFEPGCGNGEMSAALAQRCDQLLACDGSDSAVAAARQRVAQAGAERGRVLVERRSLPAQWPRGATFDLVVVSELAYYFEPAALVALLSMAAASLETDGELVLCHYLHDFDDRAASTELVHATAGRLPGLVRTLRHADEDFLLETWRKRGGSA